MHRHSDLFECGPDWKWKPILSLVYAVPILYTCSSHLAAVDKVPNDNTNRLSEKKMTSVHAK